MTLTSVLYRPPNRALTATNEIIQDLLKNRAAIADILARYGVRTMRIFGDPEFDDSIQPDADVLIDFDEITPVLVCFRNSFLQSHCIQPEGDRGGWGIAFGLTKLLGCQVDFCTEPAVKNFSPLTYLQTLPTHKWKQD